MKKKSSKIKSKLLILSISFALLFFFMFFFSFQFNNNNKSNSISNNITSQVSETIIEKTFNFLLPAMLISETSANLMQSGVLKPSQTNLIEKSTLNFIKPHSQLSNFYFADLAGNFIMVSKKNNLFTETRIQSVENPSIFTILERNQQGKIISKIIEKTSFDVKTRPWFTGAIENEKQFWTNLYVFHSKKHPGITASFPVTDKRNNIIGVFGVDIELEKVSRFLENQIKNHATTAIILDENNNIVAKPGEILFNTGIDGSIKPMSVKELNDKLVLKALDRYESKNESSFHFNYNQNKYYSSVQSFPKSFGKDWKILILLTKNNLVQQSSFTVSFFFLLLALSLSLGGVFYALLLNFLNEPLRIIDKSIKVDNVNLPENIERETVLQS
tara:strand:+ start:6064 stop:7224 length:1161 start_codon:yes stop_codon:yes gene_type:complete